MKNYLLSHSRQSDVDYYTAFTRPATPEELSKKSVDSLGLPITPVKFADVKKKLVFIDNPVITDETQLVHTDIKQILQSNPDINGLSLLLDDSAEKGRIASIQLEDFIPPSQYVDIFDLDDFVKNAKRKFLELPVELRKKFNNNPLELCNAVDKKDSAAISLLENYLGIDSEKNSSAITSANSTSNEQKKSDSKEVNSSTESN